MGREVVEHLLYNIDGVYLDGTLGGGGHAQIILSKLSSDALYLGIDRDADAINTAKEVLKNHSNFSAWQTTFNQIDSVLYKAQVTALDGILLDLGISSWQIDQDARGFSFRPGVELDMRMDRSQELTAEYIVNNYDKAQLKKVIKEYGEEKQAGRIAHKIVTARTQQAITKSGQLLEIINSCVNPRFATKSYARVFQALRIEVNDELTLLQQTLEQALLYLKPGGKLVVITYHSLEDRIVKNFYRAQEEPCTCPPSFPLCVCHKKPQLKRVKPHFILPKEDEVKENVRARSAKLRVAEKV